MYRVFCTVLLIFSMGVYAEKSVFQKNSSPSASDATLSGSGMLPVQEKNLKLIKSNARSVEYNLTGYRPKLNVDFQIRKDQLATKATLNLLYTPSPSLIPKESHLKISVNDQFVGLIDITNEQLGKSNSASIDINPLLLKDGNLLSIEFVGQYDGACPSWASPALWLEVHNESRIALLLQQIPVTNDLSNWPIPFFDPLDPSKLTLYLSLSDHKNHQHQLAGSILTSWFGTQSQWRGLSVTVSENTLPKHNTIALITNDKRPLVLNHYPKVNQPTIELVPNPNNPYSKLLIISGKDDEQLVKAVKGLTSGSDILHGQKVVIKKVEQLKKREPYDAPFWVKTDKPVSFSSLEKYPGQLQQQGIIPSPIFINFSIPPDLYINHKQGIDMQLLYRYSLPSMPKVSNLFISLNGVFVRSFRLNEERSLSKIIPSFSYFENSLQATKSLQIPVTSIGSENQLTFDFTYGVKTGEGNRDGSCTQSSRDINQVVIDGQSTIDFSRYRHYTAMPNLHIFAFGSYPFSRMADLSETITYIPESATRVQVELLFNLMGRIGSETGLPVYNLSIDSNWKNIKKAHKDIIAFGPLPTNSRNDLELGVFLSIPKNWLSVPLRPNVSYKLSPDNNDAQAVTKTTINAKGAIAAFAEVQSPFDNKKTLLALLSSNTEGFRLLNHALTDKKLLSKIHGSVSIVRKSGVHSLEVGKVYYTGYLPTYLKIWYGLQNYPVSLAFSALIGAILAGILLKKLFILIAKKRLRSKSSIDWNE